LRCTWRQSAPAAVSTRIDRRLRGLITSRAIKVNSELLPSDRDVAIFRDDVRPRFYIVRIVMIRRLLRDDTRYDDEESNAQKNPTMNDAACFHCLILS
jgi:hypothetical protein